MVFGGTAVQTMILVILTMRTDWTMQAEEASKRISKWTNVPSDSEEHQTEVEH
ncbi:hypothetical protein I3843_15G039500 [Carya illinoinensis]|nr:hypothetical protein I3843_15G039500 [Carya illinoinensis]